MKDRKINSKTVLVVDDYQDTRVMMKFLLEQLGCAVMEAKDGWNAVEMVQKQIPDLILMDMALPTVSGISATKLIKRIKEASQVPIIAFTGSGQFIYQQAMDAGCDALLEKPIDTEKLETVIAKYLGEKVS